MKKHNLVILSLALFMVISLGAEKLKVEESETIRKTFTPPGRSKPVEVLVDNIFGSIEVEGTDGRDVQLVVRKTIKARDEDKIQKAKSEVSLDITQDGNSINFYIDGPFRKRDEEGRRERWDPGYQVHYDFTLKIPRRSDIVLKTVTSGDISVQGVEGRFEVRNVNGKITMADIAGDGEAHTVNGQVKVYFTKNPKADCSFKTINGDISLTFTENLAANFWLKTFNGEALSDYEVTHLPPRPSIKEEKGDKFMFKSNRFTGVRIGKGGPEISLDTMNGDLFINKHK